VNSVTVKTGIHNISPTPEYRVLGRSVAKGNRLKHDVSGIIFPHLVQLTYLEMCVSLLYLFVCVMQRRIYLRGMTLFVLLMGLNQMRVSASVSKLMNLLSVIDIYF
jgi:hypothetical protein